MIDNKYMYVYQPLNKQIHTKKQRATKKEHGTILTEIRGITTTPMPQ